MHFQQLSMLVLQENVTFPPGDRWCPAGFCFAPSAAGCDCNTPQVSEHLFLKIKVRLIKEGSEL